MLSSNTMRIYALLKKLSLQGRFLSRQQTGITTCRILVAPMMLGLSPWRFVKMLVERVTK